MWKRRRLRLRQIDMNIQPITFPDISAELCDCGSKTDECLYWEDEESSLCYKHTILVIDWVTGK